MPLNDSRNQRSPPQMCRFAARTCLQSVFLARGAAHFSQGTLDNAIAIALEPQNAHAYCDRGGCHLKKGEYEKAIADCDEALQCDPNLALAQQHPAKAENSLKKPWWRFW